MSKLSEVIAEVIHTACQAELVYDEENQRKALIDIYETIGKVLKLPADASSAATDDRTASAPAGGESSAPEEQSALQREEARRKRVIRWKIYETKVDVCAMGKTQQNGKVYEVRIAKRGDSKVQDTYGQCKVNGDTVITCSFTGSAWMLKRILTAGMQALVNHKAKRNRDKRRHAYKLRRSAILTPAEELAETVRRQQEGDGK